MLRPVGPPERPPGLFGWGTPPHGAARRSLVRACRSPLLVPLLLLAVYLIARPPVADLAAQVARANVFRLHGTDVWWTGWFGGLTLPTYSTLTPWVMAHLGAPLTGALAAVVSLLAARTLLRSAPRPRLGTAVFGVFDVADVAVGRITFAVGLALGLLALCLLIRSRTPLRMAVTAGCAVLSCLTSPLAGLFTGLACLAVVVTDRVRRVAAGVAAVALLTCGGVLAFLFPGAGTMPTTVTDVLPALVVTAGVGVLCRPPALRAGALLTAAATVLFTIAPGAVGENMTRMAWLLGAPLVVAFARSPLRSTGWPRRWKVAVLVMATALAALGPALDVVNQLGASDDESATAAFYAPLVKELRAQQKADRSSLGQRVEVVDPRTHWSSVYVAGRVPLARGWNRQADAALNPIFYEPGALDAQSYTRWLHSLAVGWVALPHTALDYAAVAEGKLVASGLPALQKVWTGEDWTLYRVRDPSPLVAGARVITVAAAGVTVDVPSATPVLIRLRWTPSLTVTSALSGTPLHVCLRPTLDGMTEVPLPAGRWRIAPNLLQDAARQLGDGCGDTTTG